MERVRWRITLDQLAHLCGVPAGDLTYWASLGAFGPRYAEKRDQGFGRHITREAAQCAVLMSRLIKAGIRAEEAAQMACIHRVGDTSPLIIKRGGVTFEVSREVLP